MEGGGGVICSDYGISAYPTIILIAPDKSIPEKDIWPVNSAGDIILPLENYGITSSFCTAVGITDPYENLAQMPFYPNPTSGLIHVDNERYSQIEILDVSGRILFDFSIFTKTIELDGIPDGFYLLRLKSFNVWESHSLIIYR